METAIRPRLGSIQEEDRSTAKESAIESDMTMVRFAALACT